MNHDAFNASKRQPSRNSKNALPRRSADSSPDQNANARHSDASANVSMNLNTADTQNASQSSIDTAESQARWNQIQQNGATFDGETLLFPLPERTQITLFLASMMLVLSRWFIPCEQSVECGTGLPWVVAWLIFFLVVTLYWMRQVWQTRKNPNALSIQREALIQGEYGSMALRPFMMRQSQKTLTRMISLFFFWTLFMCYLNIHNGPTRTTFNQIWEILGLLFLFRWFHFAFQYRESFRRSALAWMLSFGIGMTVIGCYQYFIEMPATRAAYAANPDAMLRESGMWFAPDSPQRMMFENRLESVEPLGTFALTNSLAGFLVPWLVIGVIVLGEWFVSRWNRKRFVMATNRTTLENRSTSQSSSDSIDSTDPRILTWNRLPRWLQIVLSVVLSGSMAMMALCFLLTKSRSGYVAAFCTIGLAVLAMLFYPWYTRTRTKEAIPWMKYGGIAALLGGIVAAFVGIAVAVGGIDLELISEAKKSLGYRLEYWTATSQMIADHPLTGVGSTHFQTFYTQYKLPQSSEEIADPHNFIMEIAASYGIPALLIFATLLGVTAYRTVRAMRFCLIRRTAPPSECGDNVDAEASPRWSSYLRLSHFGVAFGCGILAWLLGQVTETPPTPHYIAILSVVAALVYPLWNFVLWQLNDKRFLRLLALSMGILALGIHLLAAGGLGMPGIIGVFWMLLAMLWVEIQLAEPPHTVAFPSPVQLRRFRYSTVLQSAVILCLTGLTIHFGLQPTLQCRAILTELQSAATYETDTKLNPESEKQWAYHRAERYLMAAKADPVTETPWWQLANELTQSPTNQYAIRLLAHSRTTPSIPEAMPSALSATSTALTPSTPTDSVGMDQKPHTSKEDNYAQWVLQLWQQAAQKILTLTPYSSKNYRMLAGQASEIATLLDTAEIPTAETATQIHDYRKLAVKWYAQAVRYYPNSAELRAEYAIALRQIGDMEAFEHERAIALHLDVLTPHKDKKLSDQMRDAL